MCDIVQRYPIKERPQMTLPSQGGGGVKDFVTTLYKKALERDDGGKNDRKLHDVIYGRSFV